MNRNPSLQKALDGIFPKFAANRLKGLCAACGSDKLAPCDFKDDLSRKEYQISSLCQVCQDKVFNYDEK